MDNQQGPKYSTGNSAQGYVAASVGGEFGGDGSCIRMAESLLCSPETTTTLLISYTPMQNKKSFKNKMDNQQGPTI